MAFDIDRSIKKILTNSSSSSSLKNTGKGINYFSSGGLKQPFPNYFSNAKKVVVDGKPVYYVGGKQNAPPPRIVQKVYRLMPDDKRVPVVFETKKQYLQQYIKNQEQVNNTKFTPIEKQKYIKHELKEMKPVVSRFTTYHNDYMPPQTVFFTDNKFNKNNKQFEMSALHEYWHEKTEGNKQQQDDEVAAEQYARDRAANDWQSKNDTHFYLSKRKDKDKLGMYTYGGNQQEIKKIHIGSNMQNFDFQDERDINHLSQVVGHEELHNELERLGQNTASNQLDNISVPSFSAINPENNKDYFFLSDFTYPAKVIGPESKKEYVEYVHNKYGNTAITDNIQRPDIQSRNSINLKNTKNYKYGTVDWQNAVEHNINEKMKYGEDFSGMEKAFINVQNEIHPKEDIEITFNRFNNEQDKDRSLPIKENEMNKELRMNRGYNQLVQINAKRFKEEFEKEQEEKLAWSRDRRESLKKVEVFDAHPQVDFNYKLDVNDGRHRINRAAEQGDDIVVAVKGPHIVEKLKVRGILSEDQSDVSNNRIQWEKTTGVHYEEMTPDEYLNQIPYLKVTPESQMYGEEWGNSVQKVGDFVEKIKDPDVVINVEAPYVFGNDQEGRHRTVAAKLAGLQTIPVGTFLPSQYTTPEMFEAFKEKMKSKGYSFASGYDREWEERFKKGKPEHYMDKKWRQGYKEVIAEKGLDPSAIYEKEEQPQKIMVTVDNQTKNRIEDWNKHIEEMKEKRRLENEEYDKDLQQLPQNTTIHDKTYQVLKHAAEKYREQDVNKDNRINQVAKLIEEKPFAYQVVAINEDGKPVVANILKGQERETAEKIDFTMQNMLVEEEAKQQLARVLYNEEYYHNLKPQQKRKIIYLIRRQSQG